MSNQITILLSNRHIHLTQEMMDEFFGEKGLTIKKYLTADHKFYAAEETVTITGPKGSIEGVRVLGPARSYNQVELLKADGFVLGVNPPVRASGDVGDACDLTVTCNGKTIDIPKCGIVAQRHIHMVPEQMEELGIKDKQFVSVKIGGERGLTFDQVFVRVAKDTTSYMHVDTEEGNAAGVKNGDIGEVIL